MNAVTGGTVTVTNNGGTPEVLNMNSGIKEYSLPVNATIRIKSSKGKYIDIPNNGSTYTASIGHFSPAGDADGPDVTE
jgi:hypothetical protein